MENFSRFFYLLNQLSEGELKQFKRYLHILNKNRYERSLQLVESGKRFLNKHSELIENAVFKGEEELKSFINQFKRRIYKKLFPNKSYNSKEINNYMSDISLLIEEFMIILHLRKHKVKKEEFLFDVSLDRKMSKHIFMTLERKKRYLENQPERSFWYAYEKFKINYYSYFRPEVAKEKGTFYKTTLSEVETSLKEFFMGALLKVVCEKITNSNVSKFEFYFKFL